MNWVYVECLYALAEAYKVWANRQRVWKRESFDVWDALISEAERVGFALSAKEQQWP